LKTTVTNESFSSEASYTYAMAISVPVGVHTVSFVAYLVPWVASSRSTVCSRTNNEYPGFVSRVISASPHSTTFETHLAQRPKPIDQNTTSSSTINHKRHAEYRSFSIETTTK
jgi:hypothetical protein